MKKKIYWSLLVLLSLGIFAYFSIAPIFEKIYEHKKYAQLQVTQKRLQTAQEDFFYIEKGTGETIVFVHGYQGDNKFWLSYIPQFSHYHIIAPDLPGHGKTTAKTWPIHIHDFAQSLDRFIVSKNLDSFHLVASSMGGGVATVYALQHPEKIKSLILLNPLGVRSPIKSDLENAISRRKNLFFPKNLQEYDQLFVFLIGKPLSLHPYFKNYLMQKKMRIYPYYQKVMDQFLVMKPHNAIIHKISAPTLVLFGSHDRILHPSAKTIYAKELPHARVVTLEGADHVFVGQHLQRARQEILDFIHSVQK